MSREFVMAFLPFPRLKSLVLLIPVGENNDCWILLWRMSGGSIELALASRFLFVPVCTSFFFGDGISSEIFADGFSCRFA